MIDLVNQRIIIGGLSTPISRYDCYWAVPGLGLFTTVQDALEHGDVILPAPVAVGSDGHYEVLPPEMNRGG